MNSSYLLDMSIDALSDKDLIERLNKMMVCDIPTNANRTYLVMRYQEALITNKHDLHLITLDSKRDLHSQMYLKRQNEVTLENNKENNINAILQDKTIKLNPNQNFNNNINNAGVYYTKIVLPLKHKKLIQSNKFISLSNNCQSNNNNLQLDSIHINNNNNNTSTTNIPLIRRSLLKTKYIPPTKHRYSLSNPRELTPIPEKAASLENISEQKISVQHKQINSISINNSNILLSNPISFTPKQDTCLSNIDILFIILPTISSIIIIYYIIQHNHSLYKQIIEFVKRNSFEYVNSITNVIRLVRQNVSYNKYIVITFILGLVLISWVLYNKYKEKKLVSEIFMKIKSDLQGMINEQGVNNESVFDNSFEIGISEKEIIKNYAKMYNINVKVFKQKYFPQIKQMSINDQNVKEFELVINGRRTIMWQYFPN